MANTSQSRKRARQTDSRRLHNRSIRATLRTYVKKVLHAIRDKNKEGALAAYTHLMPLLDRNARKNLIHKNKASRYKSRLIKHIRSLG